MQNMHEDYIPYSQNKSHALYRRASMSQSSTRHAEAADKSHPSQQLGQSACTSAFAVFILQSIELQQAAATHGGETADTV